VNILKTVADMAKDTGNKYVYSPVRQTHNKRYRTNILMQPSTHTHTQAGTPYKNNKTD